MRRIDDRQTFEFTETLAAVARFLETTGRGSPSYLVTADSVGGPGSVAATILNDRDSCAFLLIRLVGDQCEVVRELTDVDHAALLGPSLEDLEGIEPQMASST